MDISSAANKSGLMALFLQVIQGFLWRSHNLYARYFRGALRNNNDIDIGKRPWSTAATHSFEGPTPDNEIPCSFGMCKEVVQRFFSRRIFGAGLCIISIGG
ncbi:hypothetical protein D3C81_1387740 [compost metagenome]